MVSVRLLKRSVFCAGVVVATLASAMPSAQAQWFTYQPPVVIDDMTPREIIQAVMQRGYRNPTHLVYRDDVAIVTATEPSGRRVRLVLDLYSGDIVDARPLREPQRKREQVVQRAPDQGPTIRRSVPDSEVRTRATPEKPTVIRREPLLPPQPQRPAEKPADVAKPPQAAFGDGTRQQPRRIDIVPPAPLDGIPEAPQRAPSPPINSVPPAGLE